MENQVDYHAKIPSDMVFAEALNALNHADD